MADAMRLPELHEMEAANEPRDHWDVTDLGSADFAAGRIREAQEAIARIQEHAALLRSQVNAWALAEAKQWDEQILFFEPLLRKWAEENMSDYSKKRSLDLPGGMRIGFRAGSETVDIDDEAGLIEEAKQYKLTDTVQVKESILKTPLKKHLRAGVQFNHARLDQKPDTFYVKPSEK